MIQSLIIKKIKWESHIINLYGNNHYQHVEAMHGRGLSSKARASDMQSVLMRLSSPM